MSSMRPDHISADFLVSLLIQLLGQGADLGLQTLDLGLELGHLGGLFIELAAKVILRAFALELISLEAVGDADRLEAGDNEFAGIDIAGLCNSRGHPFIKQLGLETFGFFGLLNPLGQLLFHDVSLL